MIQDARQNARMAMMLAIGALQSHSGPDQRITATASVLSAGSAQPHLTGVWQGDKWNGTGTPDFTSKKRTQFMAWLASSRDPGATRDINFHTYRSSQNTAPLVRITGTNSTSDRVNGEVIPVMGSPSYRQGYAWAVFDESTKLPISLPVHQGQDLIRDFERMAAAPLPGYAATTQRDWRGLDLLSTGRRKLVTTQQSALAGIASVDRNFHDISAGSAGVIADAARGGLSIDLSRLFSNPNTLPADYQNRFLYSDSAAPLAPAPTRFPGANPFPCPDPTWRLLHSHYRLYDRVTGGLSPVVDTIATARPAPGTAGTALNSHPFFNSQQLVPVIAKAQFVFSMSFGWHPSLPSFAKPGNTNLPDNDPNKDHYITWLVVDPVITLWNPYQVKLRFNCGRIDLYRIPLSYRLYKNGTLINQNFTHLANSFVQEGFASRIGTFYRLNLLPPLGQSEIILAPGEHVVLSASNHAKNYNNQLSTTGVDLRPGFFPPAGNASNFSVGGVSTMNVCVAPSGANSGQIYGKSVRSIPVKPGDRIQVEIRQERAAIDRPEETGGREVSGFMKYYVGDPDRPTRVGGIELDYANEESQRLPAYGVNDMPTFVVDSAIPRLLQADNYVGNAPPPVVRFKEPFLISTFQLKTERDAKFPSRSWIHNSPTNLYSSSGIDQTEPWTRHQYELQWEVMTDWPPTSPTIEISNKNRGYGGSGIYAQSGVEYATHSSIPLAPAYSLAQFRHAPLNAGGQLPLVSQIVGNSFAPPIIAANAVRQNAGNRVLLDHSYFANHTLFDRHFLSTMADPGGPLGRHASLRSALLDFFDRGILLPQSRLRPYMAGRTTEQIISAITSNNGHLQSAAYLMTESPLNVNSTRVDVWEAVLNSTFGQNVPVVQNGVVVGAAADTGKTPVSRHLPAGGNSLDDAQGAVARDLAKWNGYRWLSPQQIRRLAEEIVVEIRKRGPFQSLAEFINRRPGSDDMACCGALQAAIDRSGINQIALNPAFSVEGGNTADGAPGVLTQADLLTPIAPTLTVRGDTFRIRAYGESGQVGGTTVTAWCEAIVQRLPDYLDSADVAWAAPTRPSNIRFGRRYAMVSFRWLTAAEI